MIKDFLFGIQIQVGHELQDEPGDVRHPAVENGSCIHVFQGFPAGAAADDAGIEIKIVEHLPYLAEDDGVLEGEAAELVFAGIDPGRETAAEIGRRQNNPDPLAQQEKYRGLAYLGEESFRPASRKIEDRVPGLFLRIGQDGLVGTAFRKKDSHGGGGYPGYLGLQHLEEGPVRQGLEP